MLKRPCCSSDSVTVLSDMLLRSRCRDYGCNGHAVIACSLRSSPHHRPLMEFVSILRSHHVSRYALCLLLPLLPCPPHCQDELVYPESVSNIFRINDDIYTAGTGMRGDVLYQVNKTNQNQAKPTVRNKLSFMPYICTILIPL